MMNKRIRYRKPRALKPVEVMKMKQALGLQPWMIRGGEKVHVYRQFWKTGLNGDPDWEHLTELGMAIKKDLLPNDNERVYVVTDDGLDFIEGILNIKFIRHNFENLKVNNI